MPAPLFPNFARRVEVGARFSGGPEARPYCLGCRKQMRVMRDAVIPRGGDAPRCASKYFSGHNHSESDGAF